MKLEKKIGLAGGVGIVVGGVIGMGAYALIPAIAGKAGNAAWLAVGIALVVSLVSVLPLIQISSALPIAGGGYMYASRLLSPLAGVLTSFWALIGGACSVSLISIALYQYFSNYLPFQLSPFLGAILLVASFFVIYLFGLKLLSSLQIILCVQLVLALVVYALPVLWQSSSTITIGLPASPDFFMAIILAMNTALGFQIIIELGEEISQPQKNIPLALLIGTAAVLGIYLLVLFAYSVSGFPPQTPMITTAQAYLPKWVVGFVELGMISAGLTSYNGAAIALPREFYSMARDKTMPQFLGKLNGKGSPTNAVAAFFAMVIGILFIGWGLHSVGLMQYFFGPDIIEFYGFMTIMGIMMLTLVLSYSAIKLPAIYPRQYMEAYIHFPKPVLYLFITVSILSSLLLVVVICTKWLVPAIYLAFTLVVIGYYFFRKRSLAGRGIEIGKVYNEMNG